MTAMYYKEWIKTRWYLLLAFLTLMGFTGYSMLRFYRALGMKGAEHLWEVMLTRDAIFVDLLTYIPVLLGIVLALVQFMPEMHRKCLKLTLHLPCSHQRMLYEMLSFGIVSLLVLFAVSFLILFAFFSKYLAPELCSHVLLTTLPWYLSGWAAYLLLSWICLEPTWKMRVFNLIITLLILRIFFLSSSPEAYNYFLPGLTVLTLLTGSFSAISVQRFKEGKQD